MDSFKKCGFLVASCFLLITLLGDPAEACSCAYIHPQTHYCEAHFVIGVKFVGKSQESGRMSRYEIKTTKVYKGSEAMPEIRFVSTPTSDSMCGFVLHEPFGKREYVIAGYIGKNNIVRIRSCNFIRPWARLSPQQQSGISENYTKDCSCKIVICYGSQCPVETTSQCIWNRALNNPDFHNMICMSKSKTSPSCSWQSLNS